MPSHIPMRQRGCCIYYISPLAAPVRQLEKRPAAGEAARDMGLVRQLPRGQGCPKDGATSRITLLIWLNLRVRRYAITECYHGQNCYSSPALSFKLFVCFRGLFQVPSSSHQGISSLQPLTSPPPISAFPSHLPFSSPICLQRCPRGQPGLRTARALGHWAGLLNSPASASLLAVFPMQVCIDAG